MKILLLADQAEPTLWEHLDKRKLEGVELVLSCGDLPASYLSFLTCFTSAPILYIRGNHDDLIFDALAALRRMLVISVVVVAATKE